MNMYERIDTYKDNKIAYLWDDGENINLIVCDTMSDFLSLYGHHYRDRFMFYTAGIYAPMFADIVVMPSKEFNRKAEDYYRKTKKRAYRALYAEIVAAKALNGRHITPAAPHGLGDIIANGERYEVKFGPEITF